MAVMTTTNVVTNVSSLTPAMRQALLLPAAPDLPATGASRITVEALRHRGLVTIASQNPWIFRLTDAGVRARAALEAETATTVAVTELGSHGWTLCHENDFGGHAITTWMSDDGHSLVLSYTGAYEVSAAIYDGQPLPLSQLIETIASRGCDDSPEHLLNMAAQRARSVGDPRFASELSELLAALAEDPHPTLAARTVVQRLAAAILATPRTR
jgi:hypothetical protein